MNDMTAGNLLASSLRQVREAAQVEISRTHAVPKDLQPMIDAVFGMRFPSGDEVTVCAKVKRTLRPAHLPEVEYIREQCRTHLPGAEFLLIASAISEPLAQELRNRRIWFVDAPGNMHLDLASQLLLSVTGRKPSRTAVGPHARRISPQAACVLFQFLRHGPDVTATYRDHSEATDVSLGMISRLVVAWREHGLIRRAGRGAHRILQPDRMLALWCDAYADVLASRLLIGRYRAPQDDEMMLLLKSLPKNAPVIVGGELAADRLTGHLRASAVRLYIRDQDESLLRRTLRLAPSEAGSVELHRAFSRDLAGDATIAGCLPVVHPVLAYAELMGGEDDRLGEAAVRLRKEHLAWTL